MENIFLVLSVIGATLGIFVFFILNGLSLYTYCFGKNSMYHPLIWRVGAGYFLSQSLFVAFWLLSAHFMKNAWLSLLLTAIFLLLMTITSFGFIGNIKELFNKLKRKIGINVFIFLTVEVFVLAIWLRLFNGSAHDGMYGPIAKHIYSTNTIPILGQHYAQSMLSAASALCMHHNIHNLSLSLMLSLTIYMLILTTFGLFKIMHVGNKIAVLGTFILFFGNYALTFTHGISISTLSPLIINGYTDDIMSAGTFTVFIVWIFFILKQPRPFHITQFKRYLCPIIMGISWNIVAPQNIISAVALLGMILLIYLFKRSAKIKVSLFLIFIFSGALIVGLFHGGPFSPAKYQTPGLDGNIHAAEAKIHFQPEMPYAIARTAIAPLWHVRPPYKAQFPTITYWNFEENIWDSIRLCFYPIAGLFFLGQLIKSRNIYQNVWIEKIFQFWIAGIITFLSGYLFTFCFNFNSLDKWGQSKFMINSYYTGMVAVVLAINLFYAKNKSKSRIIFLFFIVLFILYGPVVSISMGVKHSLFPPEYVPSFFERLKVFYT